MSRAPGSRDRSPVTDLAFAVPGDLAAPTGGYEYARRLIEGLPQHGVAPRLLALDGTFPAPSAETLAATANLLGDLPAGTPLLVDGLAYGVLPRAVIRRAGSRPILALVHHPLCYEAGLSPGRAEALRASETDALTLADSIVTTSPFTARLLAEEFDIPQERMRVARPGTLPAERVPPRQDGEAALLAVGAVTPRKGYGTLLQALGRLRDRPWRLTVVGALDRDPQHARELDGIAEDFGLSDRVAFAGAVSQAELERLYAASDVVVSASRFEGYGMALAESLARGLPLVMTRGGAADETVTDTAAIKVEAGDASALAEALRAMIDDPERRARLADAAWRAGQALPRWQDTAAIVAQAVAETVARRA